ncbi:phosphatidylinositol N-acetylglucosaminyltransferase gpi3 subunit isoform X1 [Babesia ovis]|uniref:Phosphatidylinositol N-acetylglucosaminyltransferase gpi3 subunit isoform X1 n=1 Tax=Babesia ovis TaxID=5869 RepID=A0A9W5T9V9_BABOV|nr:phosphatidylinositol N-acetylglucosaminyltransferase gpi3 subunit isoform X1 [Babesia ovis]
MTQSVTSMEPKRQTVLMVSEFFYPDVGGIETHICALSSRLMELGYRVVVVTRHFGGRRGIRYMSNGLKVYHIPTLFLIKPCGLPRFLDTFLIARNIFIREQVDIVHIHQTSSRYGCEFIYAAYVMGLKTVFTDHSLFSFIDLGPITLTNESDAFKPRTTPRNDGKIVIVVVSRLTERKGAHLLNDVIPIVCKRHENVEFIIGGDGPLYSTIMERIDKLYLHNRVTLLGTVPNHKVNDVLIQGDIFLNASKSESFCIAILEAVSSGLLCVATNVGGVHEVLPRDMVLLANYSPESVANRIDDAIRLLPSIDRFQFHERVRSMYSWQKVARQVSNVYDMVLKEESIKPMELIYHFWEIKSVFRPILIVVILLLYVELWIADWLHPRHEIDIAPDWSKHQT